MSFEQKNTPRTMEDLKAMQQQTQLRRNIDKAGNIQKAVTLTEENWTGLIDAVAQTGHSVLKLQENVEHLLTDEQMDTMLKAQVQTLLLEHRTAVSAMQTAVQELSESGFRSWQQIENSMKESVYTMRREEEAALKAFKSQVGNASERYSAELSRTTDAIKQSASRIQWQMYLPTIICVCWDLVRQLFFLA